MPYSFSRRQRDNNTREWRKAMLFVGWCFCFSLREQRQAALQHVSKHLLLCLVIEYHFLKKNQLHYVRMFHSSISQFNKYSDLKLLWLSLLLRKDESLLIYVFFRLKKTIVIILTNNCFLNIMILLSSQKLLDFKQSTVIDEASIPNKMITMTVVSINKILSVLLFKLHCISMFNLS